MAGGLSEGEGGSLVITMGSEFASEAHVLVATTQLGLAWPVNARHIDRNVPAVHGSTIHSIVSRTASFESLEFRHVRRTADESLFNLSASLGL